jgi:hypothetical protein
LSQGVGVELGGVEAAFCVLLGLLGVVCAAGGEDAFVGCSGGGHCVGVGGAVVESHARCGFTNCATG